METNKQHPFLYFNFADHNGRLHPLQFKNPIQVITAQTIGDIIPCMKMIQKAVKDGFFAAGYISYEAAPAFNNELSVKPENMMPLLWFGIFDEPINQKLENDKHEQPYIGEWKPKVTVDDYNRNFNYIQESIKNNVTQQVNYTIPFGTKFTNNSLSLYKQLATIQSANYTSYIETGDFSIISASPELFFHVKDREIMTKPMKGTIGRGFTYQEDLKHASQLRHSKKDQTENRLIIDLMSRELEDIAMPNTIQVPHIYTIEKYPTVYQMTSTITAKLQDHIELLDIFKALFPCGSITGIPKTETMKIISQLETAPREVYCGAIGYITPQNEAIFNVPIRTVLIDKRTQMATYGVGGAITKDSNMSGEYDEILIKTQLLNKQHHDFQLLESLGLEEGNYIVFEKHMERLKESSNYFDFNINMKEIQSDLQQLALKHKNGHWKVRLLVQKTGHYSIETEETDPLTHKMSAGLAYGPIDKNNVFLYHKTTNRSVYETNKIQDDKLFDTLLWNTDNEVTEFTMGNIVVELNGNLYTPPIECGLLAGTFRASLLDGAVITERNIMVDELRKCTKIWLINSVRKWVPVQLLPLDSNAL